MSAWERAQLSNPVYSIEERVARARSRGLSDAEIAGALGITPQQLQKAFPATQASGTGSGAGAIALLVLAWLLAR